VAANVRDDGELVVLCRSSAWASRLRFAADDLLSAARATGAEVTRCSVRVARDP
jgi:predicted nucleic acid-binding Zn ribbon protein